MLHTHTTVMRKSSSQSLFWLLFVTSVATQTRIWNMSLICIQAPVPMFCTYMLAKHSCLSQTCTLTPLHSCSISVKPSLYSSEVFDSMRCWLWLYLVLVSANYQLLWITAGCLWSPCLFTFSFCKRATKQWLGITKCLASKQGVCVCVCNSLFHL